MNSDGALHADGVKTHRRGGTDPDGRCRGSLGDRRLTLLQLGLSLGQSLLGNQDQLTRLGPDQNHACGGREREGSRRSIKAFLETDQSRSAASRTVACHSKSTHRMKRLNLLESHLEFFFTFEWLY